MPRPNPNILLVEGDDEKRVIPYLMDKHVVWGDKPEEWVAEVRSHGGIEDLLDPGNIEAEALAPGRQSPRDRRQRRRPVRFALAKCEELLSRDRRRFPRRTAPGWAGSPERAWLTQSGSGSCRTIDLAACWRHSSAISSCRYTPRSGLRARVLHAVARSRSPYTDPHRDKADIHTFLAWLDPPGRSLHVSVLARALDARLPLGERFACWFMDLYQLTPRPTPLP